MTALIFPLGHTNIPLSYNKSQAKPSIQRDSPLDHTGNNYYSPTIPLLPSSILDFTH